MGQTLGRELATSYGAAVEGGTAMKRTAYLSIVLLAAFVVLFVPAVVGAQEDQAVVPVSAYDGYFDPADITVPVGTTVEWTNQGEMPHSVTAHDGSFATGLFTGSISKRACSPICLEEVFSETAGLPAYEAAAESRRAPVRRARAPVS